MEPQRGDSRLICRPVGAPGYLETRFQGFRARLRLASPLAIIGRPLRGYNHSRARSSYPTLTVTATPMVPLADTHVHLLAGLDDGPPTEDVAVAMCRMLVAEGARHATALAHQNPNWPDSSPQRLR